MFELYCLVGCMMKNVIVCDVLVVLFVGMCEVGGCCVMC